MKAIGVTRMVDNPKAMCVIFDKEPTDEDLRTLHEMLADRHTAQPIGYRFHIGRIAHVSDNRPDSVVSEPLFGELVVEQLAGMVRRMWPHCSDTQVRAEVGRAMQELAFNHAHKAVVSRDLIGQACRVLENAALAGMIGVDKLAADLRKAL